ncbi:hypothetical protein VNO80_04732 [Phaseolus coccineus]|uniref:Uncharacterized protein n=1 Tax=Phaseolus coccineus TaxID=3886 RepID=A0AAN9NU73_PHACN
MNARKGRIYARITTHHRLDHCLTKIQKDLKRKRENYITVSRDLRQRIESEGERSNSDCLVIESGLTLFPITTPNHIQLSFLANFEYSKVLDAGFCQL